MRCRRHSTHAMSWLVSTVCIAGLLLGDISNSFAQDNEAVSKKMTTLFRSARAVISDKQSLINDASKGDKELSSDAVISMAKRNFKKATGANLDTGSEEVEAMLAAIQSVMDEAQPLINEKGKGFKGFLPAIFAKQVARAFNANMNGKMRIKLTAPRSYVRNRANRPDKWEHSIIENKFKSTGYEKGRPYAQRTIQRGKDAYRYILPEYYKPSCLKCHGEPKGELDITGAKKEGGKLGELGGAISFTIYE